MHNVAYVQLVQLRNCLIVVSIGTKIWYYPKILFCFFKLRHYVGIDLPIVRRTANYFLRVVPYPKISHLDRIRFLANSYWKRCCLVRGEHCSVSLCTVLSLITGASMGYGVSGLILIDYRNNFCFGFGFRICKTCALVF